MWGEFGEWVLGRVERTRVIEANVTIVIVLKQKYSEVCSVFSLEYAKESKI